MPIDAAAITPLGPFIPALKDGQSPESWSKEVTEILQHDLDDLHRSVSILATDLSTDLIGPAGPAGTDGTDGTNGTKGINGTSGVDGATGREVVLFSRGGVISGSAFLNIGDILMDGDRGFSPHRAGSITGISGMINATIFSGAGDLKLEVISNGLVTLTATTNISTSGLFFFNATQAAGIDLFAAAVPGNVTNNRISVTLIFAGFTGSINPIIASLEVVYDITEAQSAATSHEPLLYAGF